MKRKSNLTVGMSRREFLKAGLVGFCGLTAVGNLGCSPDKKVSVKGEESYQVTQKGSVNLIPGAWFSKLDQNKLRCDLCPHSCILSDGERSRCRVRENHQGKGFTLAYGNPALVQEDPVERKPFYHVKPGSRALSISTAGCNLACDFCEVWDMALVHPEEVFTYDMPPDKIVAHARASGVSAVSYAFGEPVIFYEYLLETASLAREEGLLNLMHTAGYIQPEPLRALVSKVDAVNVDLKSFDPAFYREIVGGELQPVLDSLKLIRDAGVHLEITSIIIPTLNDDVDMIYEMCAWIVKELGPGVPVHFARFYPLYKLSALPRTPVSALDRARNTALEAGLEYVYIAKVTGHEAENTFCPGCGELIIKRIGFVVDEIRIEKSRCVYCNREIPGRWV
jgi:pyruvate formate lyase activating enzyme